MVKQIKNDLELSLSDPTQKLAKINVWITRTLGSLENINTLTFVLPGGDYAGKSMIKIWKQAELLK